MSRISSRLIFSIVLSTVLIIAGCGKTTTSVNSSPTNSTPSTSGEAPATTPSGTGTSTTDHLVKLTLYFPTPDADGLASVERSINIPDQAVIKAIFQELQNPPTGLDKVIPQGTKLLDASVKDGVATLNLSKEFQKNFSGGSTGEQMILYSIIDSITTLPNVQAVQFLLEGKTEEAILGHLDTTKPLKRNEKIILQK